MMKNEAAIILHYAEIVDVATAYGEMSARDAVTLARTTESLIARGLLVQDEDGFIWSPMDAQDDAWTAWAEQ